MLEFHPERQIRGKKLKPGDARHTMLVGHPCGASIAEDADAVPDPECLAWVDFLHHGDAATAVQLHGDFDAGAGTRSLLHIGSDGRPREGAANGTEGVCGATAADVAAKESPGNRSDQGPTPGVAFDLHIADRGDSARLDRLGTLCIIA